MLVCVSPLLEIYKPKSYLFEILHNSELFYFHDVASAVNIDGEIKQCELIGPYNRSIAAMNSSQFGF